MQIQDGRNIMCSHGQFEKAFNEPSLRFSFLVQRERFFTGKLTSPSLVDMGGKNRPMMRTLLFHNVQTDRQCNSQMRFCPHNILEGNTSTPAYYRPVRTSLSDKYGKIQFPWMHCLDLSSQTPMYHVRNHPCTGLNLLCSQLDNRCNLSARSNLDNNSKDIAHNPCLKNFEKNSSCLEIALDYILDKCQILVCRLQGNTNTQLGIHDMVLQTIQRTSYLQDKIRTGHDLQCC